MSNNTGRQPSTAQWLLDELGQELDAVAHSQYPQVHRFLALHLANKLAAIMEDANEALLNQTGYSHATALQELREHRARKGSTPCD